MGNPPLPCSVFARQEDNVVSEVEGDLLQREVCIGNRFRANDIAVAVLTREGGGLVGMHPQCPKLEGFGGHALGEALCQGDLIQQPIGSSGVGHILSAVRKENRAHEAVTVPLLGARELPQGGWGEEVGCLGHDSHSLSSLVWCCSAAATPARLAKTGGSKVRMHLPEGDHPKPERARSEVACNFFGETGK
jgi:hypothetical protein